MDNQIIFDAVISCVLFLAGWVLSSIRDSINGLESSGKELANKVQNIEVLIVGDYVRKDDMEKLVDRIIMKLEEIDAKFTKHMLENASK